MRRNGAIYLRSSRLLSVIIVPSVPLSKKTSRGYAPIVVMWLGRCWLDSLCLAGSKPAAIGMGQVVIASIFFSLEIVAVIQVRLGQLMTMTMMMMMMMVTLMMTLMMMM